MTRKLKLGTIIAAVLAIGVLGAFSSGMNPNSEDANTVSSQNDYVSFMAYGEKPVKETVLVNVTATDYGASSSFDIEKVECNISTRGGETKVNWCEATGIQDTTTIGVLTSFMSSIFTTGDDASDEWNLVDCLFNDQVNYDLCLVEYEVGQLTDTIDSILTTTYAGIIIPEYEEKSVEWKSIVQDGTAQTKVVIGIEYD